jgi:hypothetical protein
MESLELYAEEVDMLNEVWSEPLPDSQAAGCCWNSAGCFGSASTFGSCAATTSSVSTGSCSC